jgi:hypothetical protein
MRRTGQSFKQAVNGLLRRAPDPTKPAAVDKPFKVRAKALGERPGFNFDNIGELLEQLEGPEYK